jgi:hypothetical protein
MLLDRMAGADCCATIASMKALAAADSVELA